MINTKKKTTKSFKNIAALVMQGRELTSMSQATLALRLGYKNGQFVSNVERALCGIPLDQINGLSKAINTPRGKIIEAIIQDHRDTMSRYL